MGVLVAVAAHASDYSFDVKVTGMGTPIIMIPGLTSHADVYKDVIAHYEDRFECHVLTLPGFVGQPAIDSDQYLLTVRNEILRYVDDQQLEEAIVMGHSLGGFLALWLAAESPDSFSKVVVIDGLPFLPAVQMPGATAESARGMAENMRTQMASQTDEQYRLMAPMFMGTMTTSEDRKELLIEWGVKSDRKTAAQAMYELFTIDLRDEVQQIEAPVLVLGAWIAYKDYGATHESVKSSYNAQFAKVRNCEVVLTDKGLHFIMWDDPKFFFSKVDHFLDTPIN